MPRWSGLPRRAGGQGLETTFIFSAQVAFLPFLEQQAMFDVLNPKQVENDSTFDKAWQDWGQYNVYVDSGVYYPSGSGYATNITQAQWIHDKIVSIFRCPSDPGQDYLDCIPLNTKKTSSPVRPATGNYVANYGSGMGYNYDATGESDGVISRAVSKKDFSAVTDGLSNTLYWSETIIGDGQITTDEPPTDQPWLRVYTNEASLPANECRDGTWGNSTAPGCVSIYTTDSTVLSTLITPTKYFGLRGFSWLVGDCVSSGFCTFHSPNSPYPDYCAYSVPGLGFFAARSFHIGGVNASRADGSVSFVSNTIDRQTWHRLGSRNDGGADLP
jgi:hypothetical protein